MGSATEMALSLPSLPTGSLRGMGKVLSRHFWQQDKSPICLSSWFSL